MMIPQTCRFGYPEGVDPNKFTPITQFSSQRDEWMKCKCINIHDPQSRMYELTSEYDGRKILTKNFFMLLDSYQNHPEAKNLGPDGKSCEFDTRGLLQRAHIIANWPGCALFGLFDVLTAKHVGFDDDTENIRK